MSMFRLLMLPLLATALGGCAGDDGSTCAPENVVDDGAAASAQQPLTSTNKALVLQALDALYGRHDLSARERYWAQPYLEHGAELTPEAGHARAGAALRFEPLRVIADGALVAIQARHSTLGQSRVGFDVFRVDAGKIVEHWGARQPDGAPRAAGGAALIGSSTEAPERGLTEDSRALVRDFIETVFVDSDVQQASRFMGSSYAQHGPTTGNAEAALQNSFPGLRAGADGLRYGRLHRLVAEGDLVLAQSEGQLQGRPHAVYDLFRLDNGRVAERWSVAQPTATLSPVSAF